MKKKVLIIGKMAPPRTGTSMWAEILLNSRHWVNWKPMVFNINLNRRVDEIGHYTFLKLFHSINLYFQFIKEIFRNKPDVIILPISQSLLVGARDIVFAIISFIYRRPVVLYLHGSALKEKVLLRKNPLSLFIRFGLKIPARVVVLTSSLREIFTNYVKENRILVISNGIDVPPMQNRSITNNIVFLGNLLISKGIENFLLAADALHAKFNHLNFHIIGSVGEIAVNNLLENYRPKKYVHVHGVLEGIEKYEILNNADIMIFPPIAKEGQPIVILESMALGLVLITTPMGGIIDTVTDDSAIIVPSNNVDAIVNSVSLLYDEPKTMEYFSLGAIKLYQSRYREELMIKNIEQTLDSVLNEFP